MSREWTWAQIGTVRLPMAVPGQPGAWVADGPTYQAGSPTPRVTYILPDGSRVRVPIHPGRLALDTITYRVGGRAVLARLALAPRVPT